MKHTIQHNPRYDTVAKTVRPFIEHSSYFYFLVCVSVGFCLKVWVVLSVILYMTVIFKWHFGHHKSEPYHNRTKLQYMCSKEIKNRIDLLSMKGKKETFPMLTENRDKGFRTQTLAFFPQYVIFGNLVFELSSWVWELAFTSIRQSCDHSLSSWPLDLRIPQAQLREMGGAGKKKNHLTMYPYNIPENEKKKLLRWGSPPFWRICTCELHGWPTRETMKLNKILLLKVDF